VIYPGTVVAGNYRVVRLIGEGAMGSVYEAEHVRLGRHVALKMLHERFASSPRAVARFEREARAAAAIGHDNIVDVIDFGHHEGVPYIVMEYLEGQTLAERLAAENTIDSIEACRIAAQVLSALASAHAVGIVHRDLKPGNVMLAERAGGRVTAKILDFGISKFASAGASSRVATQAGMMLGTPSYMAPEQWLGRPDVDHRADLYAVGVMLYEMLTGGLPYEGATRHELFVEVVRSHVPPPTPSEIAPESPRALDAIALRAVQRDASQRFQTAAAFVVALRPHGAGDIAVTSRPAKGIEPEEKSRSSSPPRRRAAQPTRHDHVGEVVGRVPRGHGRSRILAGGALVIAGLGVSTAVLITALRSDRPSTRSASPRALDPPAAAHATRSRQAAQEPPIEQTARTTPPRERAADAATTERHPTRRDDATPPTAHASPRSDTTNSVAAHAHRTASSSSEPQRAARPGADPAPMQVSDEF
jgi:serine/threonine-protein kinase